MATYTWITLAQARSQLAARLADPGFVFWVQPELTIYIQEALRMWNALTFTWKTQYTFNLAAGPTPTWQSLGYMASSSPRFRTVSDTDVFTTIEYHLLEPPTGSTWTGTSQFNINDLATALQRCRDEFIQVTNCDQVNPARIAILPNERDYTFPDNYLDIARARWIPLPEDGTPVTLIRNDETGLGFYEPGYAQNPPGTPTQYNIASVAPRALQLDIAPSTAGALDLIALVAGSNLAPPSSTLLDVPNDFAWVLKWGTLADLLDRESEATDRLRAAYCRQRYTDGLTLMQNTPWIMQASINGLPSDIVAMTDMDSYSPEWDSQPGDMQTVIAAGIDVFTIVPDPVNTLGVTFTVLANAPIPTADADFIQVSRDDWDAVLDYAQFLAAFKQGGEEFVASKVLEESFLAAAVATNGRLMKLGLFADVFVQKGSIESRAQERYPPQGGNS